MFNKIKNFASSTYKTITGHSTPKFSAAPKEQVTTSRAAIATNNTTTGSTKKPLVSNHPILSRSPEVVLSPTVERSIKLTISDISNILKGSHEKLEFAKKQNLPISLDVDAICESQDPHEFEIIADFLSTPEAANISQVAFGNIDSENIESVETILKLIESNQNNLKSLSSISIERINHRTYLNLPKLLNINSLSCDKLYGELDTRGLENLTDLQFGTFEPHDCWFSKSIERLTINDSFKLNDPIYGEEVHLGNLPNLRILTINPNGSLTLDKELDSLEVVDIFYNTGTEESKFVINYDLPNLRELHIHSNCQVFLDKNKVPVLTEFTYPPELESDPEIQKIMQDVNSRKQLTYIKL